VRKEILVEAFSDTLGRIGNYGFVAETPIFPPRKDRTVYSLIYATRRPPGIEVFGKAQIRDARHAGDGAGLDAQSEEPWHPV
jgi:hypothetical protein